MVYFTFIIKKLKNKKYLFRVSLVSKMSSETSRLKAFIALGVRKTKLYTANFKDFKTNNNVRGFKFTLVSLKLKLVSAKKQFFFSD